MEKTDAEKRAWLDGYKAAAQSASRFRVIIGCSDIDKSLNLGASMVASRLHRNVEKMEAM